MRGKTWNSWDCKRSSSLIKSTQEFHADWQWQMYDDGQEISLDGFYLRGETLGLLVGEQWESREVCAMFSPWGTWCWKKKKKRKRNSGSGTAAAEAVSANAQIGPCECVGGKYMRLKSLFGPLMLKSVWNTQLDGEKERALESDREVQT